MYKRPAVYTHDINIPFIENVLFCGTNGIRTGYKVYYNMVELS